VNPRRTQAEALLTAFGWDVAHGRQVRDLAVMLFDQLTELHNLGANERDLLEAAALLHDIGWTVSHDKHHKHAYRLIRDSQRRLAEFTASEIELIANIARYHRKALPALRHEPFAALAETDRKIVRQLAALLRVADGLDRPHRQEVRQLACEVTGAVVTLQLQVQYDPEAHRAGGERKRDLFEQTYRCRLVVTAGLTRVSL